MLTSSHVNVPDAVNVCFNTIAILFMCEIDNIAYATILNEQSRARVEEAGRVDLDDSDVAALARSKAIYVSVIMVYIVFEIWLLSKPADLLAMAIPPFLFWWLAGMIEIGTGTECAKMPGEMCKLLGASILAFIFFGFKMGASMSL